MLRPTLLLVAGAFFESLADASAGAHVSSLTKCVHRCEEFNACHSSLDAFSCEASCNTVCKCQAQAHRMLNKPKHCTASMLAKEQKQLSLLRQKKRMSKVQLKDDDEPRFDSYVPLEEYWGKEDHAEPEKPRMLNSKHLSMLKSSAEPWSRAAGRHGAHRHHKARKVAAMAQTKNTTKPEVKKEEAKPAAQQSTAKAEKGKGKDEKFPWWADAKEHLNFTATKSEKVSPATNMPANSLKKAALGGATAGVKDSVKVPSPKVAPKAPEKAPVSKAPTPKAAEKPPAHKASAPKAAKK